MAKKRIAIFVPGILTVPGDASDWNVRAVEWFALRDHLSVSVEYFSDAVFLPRLSKRSHAKKFADVVLKFSQAGFLIDIFCHSNGAVVVCDGLKQLGWPKINSLHLICGAVNSDFWINGLNDAVLDADIGRVFVYWGGKDLPMAIENTVFGKICFGLVGGRAEPMGLKGPKNVYPTILNRRVLRHEWPGYGHSTCFKPENFNNTMCHLEVNAGLI